MRSANSTAAPPVHLLLLMPLLPQSFSLHFFGYGTFANAPPKASVPPSYIPSCYMKIALHRSPAEIGQFLDFRYTFTLSEQRIDRLTDCGLICAGCNQKLSYLERCHGKFLCQLLELHMPGIILRSLRWIQVRICHRFHELLCHLVRIIHWFLYTRSIASTMLLHVADVASKRMTCQKYHVLYTRQFYSFRWPGILL